MEDIYRNIPCFYFSSSAQGFITEANPSLCMSLGYTREELLGKKVESIFSLATRIFQQTHFYPLLQLRGHAEEIYITLKSKTGEEVPVLINASRKEENGGTNLYFAGIAVEKRKKFEEEIIAAKKTAEKALQENTTLKAAQEELQQRAEELDEQILLANLQNQELKQFNHLATHTLQEPVRKLLFYSNQALSAGDLARIKTATEKIRNAAADINTKVNGLQRYAWLTTEDLEWEDIDLVSLVITARKEVELDNPGISIVIESEAMPVIEGDSGQVLLLFKELLSNAVRFRKGGHVVHVKIQSSLLLMNKFRQLTEKYKYAEYVKLQVHDNGIGFDDSYQEQAFELFRSLHTSGGCGIGLSLCKKIVENHRGSISLQSKQDIGTTAVVFLPVKQITRDL